jgi:DNA-binding response OmpR family regulator
MILIVDDEPSALLLLEMVLLTEDFVVRKATTGKAALRLLERTDEHCALVIADIGMPEMDGRELVAQMQSNPRTAAIPVIMCTSTSDRTTVVALIGQGVRGYIVKPFKASIVLAKVHAALDDEKPVIEPRAQTTRRLRIDPLEYAPLASATVPSLENIADELVKALRVRNARVIRAVAEKVWEPASLFGASRTVDAAQSVLDAPGDTDALHYATVLVRELSELRSTLLRVGISSRV